MTSSDFNNLLEIIISRHAALSRAEPLEMSKNLHLSFFRYRWAEEIIEERFSQQRA